MRGKCSISFCLLGMASGGRALAALFFFLLQQLTHEANFRSPRNFYYVADDPFKSKDFNEFASIGFSMADFEPKCVDRDSFQVIPMYFHAGGTVELICLMCYQPLILNGLPKTWAYVGSQDVVRFLNNPKSVLEHDTEGIIQTIEHLDLAAVTHRRRSLVRLEAKGHDVPVNIASPSIIQADGRLYIHNIAADFGGIYFCHDPQSFRLHTRLVFYLSAIAPLFYSSIHWAEKSEPSIGNIADWKDEEPLKSSCKSPKEDVIYPDEFAHMRSFPAPVKIRPLQAGKRWKVKAKGIDGEKTGMQIAFLYEPFKPCYPGQITRSRLGYCVLRLEPGMDKPAIPPTLKALKWATDLGYIFKYIENIRLDSFELSKMIMENSPKPTCDMKIGDLNDVVKKFFLTALGSQFKVESPPPQDDYRYCWEQRSTTNEKFIFRSITYIDEEACPDNQTTTL